MTQSPKTSIIIVSFNTREILRTCLARLFECTGDLDVEVVVVDNHSRDASADMVETAFPTVKLIRSAVNLGFAAANNVGFKAATGNFLLLLNPDALLEPGALQKSLAYMQANPEIGMGGARLLDKAGRQQPSARLYPSLLNETLVLSGLAARFPKSKFFGRFDRTWDESGQPACVDWVPGAFALIRKAALDAAGPFDERFFLYYEEVDLCLRFKKAGWSVWYWPDVVIRHWGGESSKTVEHVEFSSTGSQLTLWRMRSALLYYRKHHGAAAAFLVALLEAGWHQLRALRARLQGKPVKHQESSRVVALMRRAWDDTACGSVSPHRPW